MKKGLLLIVLIVVAFGISTGSQNSVQTLDIIQLTEVPNSLQYSKFMNAENYEYMNLSSVELSLFLNETDATVIGNMTIDYFNSDLVSLSSIPFHLYLSGMYAEGRPGDIEILNVSTLSPIPSQLAFDVHTDDQLMWVYLDEDLQQNTSVQLKIMFKSILPTDSLDRAGVSGSDLDSSKIFEFASAYPIPCVYDEYDGWNTDPYLDTGDPFYLDMAYYNLSVTLPNEMKVAATGELMDVDIDSTHTTYNFIPMHPVREITFCSSRYYIVESQIHQGVNVSSYYLPESVSLWSSNGLFWGIRALTLYNDTFGPYPYTTLNIVEDYGFYYGMEYPCQVYLSNLIYDRYHDGQVTAATLDAVIAHEVAHQWWYHLVGNDEVDVGFLDEGLTVWSVYYYSEFYGLGWQGRESNFEAVRSIYPAKINQSIYDDPSTYYFTAYTKTPVVLEKLRQIVGTDDYLDSLRLFFTRFSYRIAFLNDLQEAFEDQLATDLDWFFIPMFDNEYLPHYSFGSALYNATSESLFIMIEDLNENFHTQKYLQNFTIEVQTTDETLAFPDIQLYGTTEIVLSLPESATGTPTIVILLYDIYTLVQFDDPHVYFISTSITTATTTSSSTSTTSTPSTITNGGLGMTTYLLIGAAGGVIVLIIIVFIKTKR